MREPIEHELKIFPQFYNEVASRRKTFEIRKDDREYQGGDRILLREFDGENYTGRQTRREITYILRDTKEYGLADGYCILGIQPIGWDYSRPTTVIQNGNNNMHIDNVGTLTIRLSERMTEQIKSAIEHLDIIKGVFKDDSDFKLAIRSLQAWSKVLQELEENRKGLVNTEYDLGARKGIGFSIDIINQHLAEIEEVR